jgi:hypothetical protein
MPFLVSFVRRNVEAPSVEVCAFGATGATATTFRIERLHFNFNFFDLKYAICHHDSFQTNYLQTQGTWMPPECLAPIGISAKFVDVLLLR